MSSPSSAATSREGRSSTMTATFLRRSAKRGGSSSSARATRRSKAARRMLDRSPRLQVTADRGFGPGDDGVPLSALHPGDRDEVVQEKHLRSEEHTSELQ